MPGQSRLRPSVTPWRAGWTVTALLVLAGGCAPARGYAGPARPSCELAAVHGAPFLTEVLAVDGTPVPFALNGCVQVLPGPHVLSVEARWSNRCRQRLELPVNAAAGESYHVAVTERRPVPTGLGAVWEPWAEPAGQAVAAYGFPVVIAVLAIDPRASSPPKDHELTVWLKSNKTGRSAGEWESHPGATTRPRTRHMKTKVLP